MKQFLPWPLAALLMLCATPAKADSVNLNVHIGDAPQEEVIVVREPQHHHHHDHDFCPEEDVHFIRPESLGFYVAVGLPYDLFYVGKIYYLYRDGYWHRAYRRQGPWDVVNYRDLPSGLRKHKLERLRQYRDEEYEVYRREEDNYHGKHFRAGREEWRGQQGQENREEHEERGRHKKGNPHR